MATSLKCLDLLNFNALTRKGSEWRSAHCQWLCWQLSLQSQQRQEGSHMLLKEGRVGEPGRLLVPGLFLAAGPLSLFFPSLLTLGCLIMWLSQFHPALLLGSPSFVMSLTAQPEPRQRLFYTPLLFSVQEQVLEQMPEQKSPGERGTMYSSIQCKVPPGLFNPSHSSLQNFLCIT